MKLIYEYWAKAGGLVGVCILIVVYVKREDLDFITLLLWVQAALLMFHQFEEYVFPGSFEHYFNEHIHRSNYLANSPLNQTSILTVNVFLGWTAYLLAPIIVNSAVWFSSGIVIVTTLNGILHTSMAIIKKRYNPGLATSLFLFIPFGLYMLNFLRDQLTGGEWILAVMTGIIGSAMIPVTIYMFRKKTCLNNEAG